MEIPNNVTTTPNSLRANRNTDYKTQPVTYAFMFLQREKTKEQYANRLQLFFDFHQFPGATLDEQGKHFLERTRQDLQWATMLIMQFLVHHRERVEAGKFASGSLKQYWQAIRKFTDAFMDLRGAIDWKRIIEAMPTVENVADDRIPTLEELRKLVEHRDPRIKAIVYTLCSCGMRVGSFEYLKVKHITPKTMAEHLRWKRQKEIEESRDHTSKIVIREEDEQKIIAAKVVLHGEKKRKRRNTEYISFITPESYFAIQKWLDLRRRYGEQITGESYVMRKLFRVSHMKRADDPNATRVVVAGTDMDNKNLIDDDAALQKTRGRGTDIDAAHPTKMDRDSISSLLARAMYETGIRPTLEEGKTRHEIKSAHFSRKYFKTRAQLYMNQLNVEKLMDHKVGLDPNYWRPIEMELLADYLRAVPALTISDINVHSLQEQQEQLEKKQEEKDTEIKLLQKQIQELQQNQAAVIQTAKSLERLQTWLNEHKEINEYRGNELPGNLEGMIWAYLQPDPEDGNNPYVNEEEFARRNREFPELADAMEKLRARRLAAMNNRENKRKT